MLGMVEARVDLPTYHEEQMEEHEQPGRNDTCIDHPLGLIHFTLVIEILNLRIGHVRKLGN